MTEPLPLFDARLPKAKRPVQLNPPQQRAVEHTQGPLLVFAGAGSGKTRVITYRIANLLANHRVPPYRILAVTFTNKAAGEMKQRLVELTGPEMAGDLWVGTFHALCCRLLRRYAEDVGLSRNFTIYDDSDQKALMARVLRAMELDDRVYAPKVVLGRIHREKQEGRQPHQVKLTRSFDEETLKAYEGYEKALRAVNAVDFDDLLLHVMRMAEDKESRAGAELRERFDYLLVDEFQDTNGVQYRLVRALAARTQNLCVVGDDDQSIYSWRGANVRNIRGFERDFPGAEVIKLEQNYRSTKNIVAAAQSVIEKAEGRADKQLWTATEAGSLVDLVAVRDEREEANLVVSRIQQSIRRGEKPDEHAVLYRINAQSRVLEEAFRQAQLPYQVVGGMKFFERAEVKNVLSYLRLIDNPRSDMDLLRVINVPARGIGGKTVERLMNYAERRDAPLFDSIEPLLQTKELNAGSKKKLLSFRDLIVALRDDAQTQSPSELAESVLERSGYFEELRRAENAEADARIENLREFIASIGEYEAEIEASDEIPSLEGYLERISLVADIDAADGSTSAVLMMTVHSAKGLEFNHVTITGLEEEMFPYRGFDGQSQEELEEERRLLYVAITRARRHLALTYAGTRMIFGQTRYGGPSRFLLDLPDSVIQRQGQAFAPRGSAASYGYSGSAYGGSSAYGGGSAYRGSTGYGRGAGYGSSAGYGSGTGRQTSSAGPRNASAGGRAQPSFDEFSQVPPREATSESDTEGPVVDYDAFDDLPELPRNLRIGARVVHQRFGTGVIARIEAGAERRIVARFPGFGERKVLASFLRFE